eukprot:TRINITY_DN9433_c0_g1_i3.p1 TRINITY_DN9433_c0_g1~~TRINITY_DN9433_c0_g1_i3.p1  ORF type:complete len:220 (+),score=43.71 TRINITY_DN9433_c0_g1_i3:205-864(+)
MAEGEVERRERAVQLTDPSCGASTTVRLLEVDDANYALYTWPSAPLLAQYIWTARARFNGTTVLELGSGTGLAGMVAARAGARVTLTDLEDPKILGNIRAAVGHNGLDCEVMPLEWGVVSPSLLRVAEHPPQTLIGSDCLYEPKEFEDLLFVVAFLLEAGSQRFITSYQHRSASRSIWHLLEKWKLSAVELDIDEIGAEEEGESLHILEITPRAVSEER